MLTSQPNFELLDFLAGHHGFFNNIHRKVKPASSCKSPSLGIQGCWIHPPHKSLLLSSYLFNTDHSHKSLQKHRQQAEAPALRLYVHLPKPEVHKTRTLPHRHRVRIDSIGPSPFPPLSSHFFLKKPPQGK